MHSTRKPNKKVKRWSSEIADLTIGLKLAQARENFWAFHLWMHPELLVSWWQWDAAQNLQQFYDDFVAGKRPKIVLQAPPQHGKTTLLEDFIAWCAGKNPNLKYSLPVTPKISASASTWICSGSSPMSAISCASPKRRSLSKTP